MQPAYIDNLRPQNDINRNHRIRHQKWHFSGRSNGRKVALDTGQPLSRSATRHHNIHHRQGYTVWNSDNQVPFWQDQSGMDMSGKLPELEQTKKLVGLFDTPPNAENITINALDSRHIKGELNRDEALISALKSSMLGILGLTMKDKPPGRTRVPLRVRELYRGYVEENKRTMHGRDQDWNENDISDDINSAGILDKGTDQSDSGILDEVTNRSPGNLPLSEVDVVRNFVICNPGLLELL